MSGTVEKALEALLQSSWQAAAGCSALLGIASHHLVFRPYEVDGAGWELVGGSICAFALSCVAHMQVADYTFFAAFLRSLLISNAFNGGLTASILVYRAFFHRLHHFPGPFIARLSKFYAFAKATRTVRGCEDVQKLHAQYGDIVRVGPREISINRPSAIRPVYEPPTKTTRSPWYAQVSNDVTKISINSTRDLKVHKLRKKGWERGLGIRAMTVYEPRVLSKVDLLLSRIAKHSGEPINATDYIMFFGFDVMGEIGFSRDFHQLESESEHPAIQGIHESMMAIGVIGTVPWLLSMLGKIPGAAGGYMRFTAWCHEQLQDQRTTFAKDQSSLKDQDPRDIISWLLKARMERDPYAPPGDAALEEDARLLIIAGSDTVSSALTNALYFLAKNPKCLQQLRKDLDHAFPQGDGDWTYDKARAVPYLDHIIHETLRLKPPILGGLARMTGPEGLMVDNVFIPGNTIISVPTYTMQRDERYWPEAMTFRPERWEGLSTEKAPWLSFPRGQWSCSGRALGMMEMRMVLSRIAMAYDFTFTEGNDGTKFDTEWMDTFTQTLPALPLVFTPRAIKA